MTQAPTPGPLSVGNRVVAIADLRQVPNGPVWIKEGEEAVIVREYGVSKCLVGVLTDQGHEGQWAKSCFRLAPSAPVEASGSEREDDLLGRLGFWEAQIGRVAREQMLPSEVALPEFQSLHRDLGRALDEIERLRPQPSGETREAVAAGEIEVTDEMVLAALKARFGHESYALDEFNDPWRAQDNRDHMRRQIAAALALRPAPVASGGQHSSGEGLDAVEPLRRSIADLKRHIEAVQVAKREGGSGSTITDCINDLPAIVRALEASEFEIEAAFEAYEDTTPAVAAASAQARIADLEAEKARLGRLLMTMQEAIPTAYHPNGAGLRLFIHHLKESATVAEARADRLAGALRAVDYARVTDAPASPLPEGGGQCSGISGELDPRLVKWGYTSLDEAITHLGKLLDDQAAFDGLATPTGDRP